MKNWIKDHWPLLGIIAIYWAAIGILLTISIYMNQGHFVYALDDPYIHMAIAKNVVQHGVWGVTRYEFSNTTSSPLWTSLLAITYFVFGVNDLSPLGLNLLFSTLTLLILYKFIQKYLENRFIIFLILLSALFVTPLPALTLSGMEHILHVFLSICFLAAFMLVISPGARRRDYAGLAVLTALIPLARYEGLILVCVTCTLFVLQKRARYGLIFGAAAMLPVTILGFWTLSRGWYFLPDSVLLKGNIPDQTFSGIANFLFGYDLLSRIQSNPHLLLLLFAALLVFRFYFIQGRSFQPKMLALAVFVCTVLLHIQLAATGWFYRYEAYLVLMGIAILGITIPDMISKMPSFKFNREILPYNLAGLVFLMLIVSPFVLRAYDSIRNIPKATNNIYEQQIQMGLFLAQYYPGENVAANDIGAISYIADIKLLDLWGLGSAQVVDLRLHKHFNTASIYGLARDFNVSIAIVYDGWYDDFGGLPAEWIKAGSWKVSNNVVLGEDSVSFYSVNPSASDRLIQSLKAFQMELPDDVIQSGIYTQQ